jgi:hypothetical protein
VEAGIMAGFYIKSVTAFGTDKKDATIDFNDRLNIITGYSDTGKTCILRCIEYVFGRKKEPFDKNTGYEGVRMIVETGHGEVTISRNLNSNLAEVVSLDPEYSSGTYDIRYNKKQKRPFLNELWLSMIGIKEPHMVPSNMKFESKRLTWNTLRPLRLLEEDSIGREESIIEPDQTVEQTLFLSSLLFLLTGHDFSEVDAQKTREMKKAKRKAVSDYVNDKISYAAIKNQELSDEINSYQGIDVDAELDKIMDQIQEADAEITEAVNRSRQLSSSIMELGDKIAEGDVILSRYKALTTQYKSDIKRLTFIVDGEHATHNVSQTTVCPFCKNGRIPVKSRTSYVQSANAELQRVIQQLNGLGESIADVEKNQNELTAQQASYQKEKDDIEKKLKEELRPQMAKLSEQKDAYKKYLDIQSQKKFLEEMASSWNDDLRNLETEENSEVKEYHPKDYFGDDFLEAMNNYAMEILSECQYENLLSARFNLQDFDIEVNGKKKATNHGKGYRAYLNTIVALMFRRYLHEHAKYDPGILMIDTPLLGLDQGVNDAAPESMRTELFKYMMNHQDEGQLIVVENLENIPKLNYEASGATVTTFTKGRSDGRDGFLDDIK